MSKTKAGEILALISLVAIILVFFGFTPQEGENGTDEERVVTQKLKTAE